MTRENFLRPVNSLLFKFSLLLSLLLVDSSSLSRMLPQIDSYARVSRNRAEPIVVIAKNFTDQRSISQSRSFSEVSPSRSPVYVPAEIKKLQNGEAIDHRSTKKYTTLDREAIAQLDHFDSRKQPQKRFHPPASFEHVLAHSNGPGPKFELAGTKNSAKPMFPVPSYATLPSDVYSSNYDYQTDSKPPSDHSSDTEDSFSKIPDSYAQPEIYETDNLNDSPKFSGFSSGSTYEDKYPSKPVDLPDHYDRPSYGDAPYVINHDYHHDLIYDHPPDDHFHDRPKTTTTEEPEMMDQRLSKRPYSYYYIGKKLWYLPLYFSIYFIIYIAALVLKSITRHKINFPASLAAVAADARSTNKRYDGPGWYDLTKRVLDGIDLYNSIGKSKNS